ncbi:MAG TPA: ATP-binding protein [Ktedonobacteraceae bacterium]|nr:ATP-binding protein [Ktedonobacteraceae bacterium]
MKNLQTLVLMAGLPGAGKTTLAYALARELQWQVVDKDKCREVLLQENFDLDTASRIAYEISFTSVKTILTQQHTSVILDTAALHRFVLDKAIKIAELAQAQLKVIFCVADRDLRNSRLRNRNGQPTRIQVDPATLADYLRYFEHLPSDKLTIYTSAPFEEYLHEAKEYILQACHY